MVSISKQPNKGTPLSVVVQAPSGALIKGTSISALFPLGAILRSVDTAPDGKMDWNITDAECDRIASEDASCEITISASKSGKNTVQSVKLIKGENTFGPKTPVVVVLVDPCLRDFPDPNLAKIPVRDLTIDQAYAELVFRHKRKEIQLMPEPVFDEDCKPIVPKQSLPRFRTMLGADGNSLKQADGKTDVLDPLASTPPFPLVNLAPTILGVSVRYNGSCTRGSSSSANNLSNVNPINAAGLVRLIEELQGYPNLFEIQEFHHVGIGSGRIINKGDCHNWGRAIDFGGVLVPNPLSDSTGTFFLNVEEDWCAESVPDVRDIGVPFEDATHPRVPAWPTVSRDLEYRFDSLNTTFAGRDTADERKWVVERALNDKRVAQKTKDDYKAAKTRADHDLTPENESLLNDARDLLLDERAEYVELASSFFEAFIDFAAANYQSTSDGAETGSFPGIGRVPQFIMHPDHHTSAPKGKGGREAHHGHIHIQIGKTYDNGPGEPALPAGVVVPKPFGG